MADLHDDGRGDRDRTVQIEQLVADHHGAVFAYAYRLSGSIQDAEDLTQQAYLIAQQQLAQLRKPECARSWLLTILRNRFLKECRRTRAVPATTLGMTLDDVPMEIGKDQQIDRMVLQDALAELPPNFRVVLAMYYFEDYSYREIARQLGLPIGTVMSRLARAKGHLRTKLSASKTRPDRRSQRSVTT
jgi:RNA polymerase sigma-70 factor (ECF subfamily)